VNRGNPLAVGLVGYWALNEGAGAKVFDAVAFRHGVLTNMDPATDWVPTPYGWGLDFDGSNDYVLTPRFSAPTVVSSFCCLFRVASLDAAYTGLWGSSQDIPTGLTYQGHMVFVLSTGAVWYQWGNGGDYGSASRKTAYTGAVVEAGEWYMLTGSWDSLTGARLYLNGVAQSLSYSGTASTYAAGTLPGTIGANRSSNYEAAGALYFPGQIALTAHWHRALLDGEHVALAADPSGLVRPARRPWLWVTSGGAEAQTATLAVAAATAAGYTVTPSPGAVTATLGVASTAAAAFGLTASPGAVTVTAGLANATGAGYTVTASPGAVTATVSLAQAIAAALEASGKPGTVTVVPGVAAASAVAYAMVAKPLAVTATLAVANATAVGLEVTASLPGGPQMATLDVATAVARAYAASAYGPITGLRDTLILIDTRDVLLIGDLRDVLRLADTRDNLTLH
jgi:hypothetical protein